MITRRHFRPLYKAGHPSAPPPLHVIGCRPDNNWAPLPRPLPATGQPGPALILGGPAWPSLGIDPTDPSTWAGRGYSHSRGMIPWLDTPPAAWQTGEAVPRGSVTR